MKWESNFGIIVVSAIVSLYGCGAQEPAPQAPVPGNTASARLIHSDGRDIGSATLAENDQGVRFNIEVNGLDPGTYNLQLQDHGVCESPHFTAPGDLPPADLGEMQVDQSGKASVDHTFADLTLASSGDGALLNKSVILTSRGGMGVRVGCGVIEPGT